MNTWEIVIAGALITFVVITIIFGWQAGLIAGGVSIVVCIGLVNAPVGLLARPPGSSDPYEIDVYDPSAYDDDDETDSIEPPDAPDAPDATDAPDAPEPPATATNPTDPPTQPAGAAATPAAATPAAASEDPRDAALRWLIMQEAWRGDSEASNPPIPDSINLFGGRGRGRGRGRGGISTGAGAGPSGTSGGPALAPAPAPATGGAGPSGTPGGPALAPGESSQFGGAPADDDGPALLPIPSGPSTRP